jgi:diguanylate cyclase (GGDEF)-like protein
LSLRARLVAAFFVVLLAPVMVVAALVYLAIADDNHENLQNGGIRSVVSAACERLANDAHLHAIAAGAQGQAYAVNDPDAPQPWAVCGVNPENVLLPAGTHYAALAARAPIRAVDGGTLGYAYAVQPIDDYLLSDLTAAAGCQVRLVGTGSATTDAGQPLPLACPAASEPTASGGLSWFVIPVGLAAFAVTVLLAWWMAALATRPLGQLLGAVDRVLAGDLTIRTAIGGRDEAARLGASLDELVGGMREARRLSVTDPLTGLGNVRRLHEALRHEVERAGRFGRALGVLLLDLDHFKDVNDAHGHRAGDAVLVEFAQRVPAALREVDHTFRQGGEEFVVLLPETDVAGSLTAARRIGDAVRDTPFAITRRDGEPALISVTVSVGVAVYPRHGLTGEELLLAGDAALYAAKAAGRDTFVLATAGVPEPRPAGGSEPPAAGAARAGGNGSSGTNPPRFAPGR